MSSEEHSEILRLVDAYFGDELEEVHVARMRAHLQDCDACRDAYDRRAQAESRVLGEPGARQLAGQRVLGAVLASPEVRPRRPAERRWWPAFILAPALAAGLAVGISVGLQPQGSGGELRGRGAPGAAMTVGVGVAAVDPASGLAYDGRRPEGVPLGHRLRFTYSNVGTAYRYLFLLGVDSKLQPYWYFPLPEEGRSIGISEGADVVEQILPFETELSKRHAPGALTVVALFSAQSIELDQIAEALRQARLRGADLNAVTWPRSPRVQKVKVLLVEDPHP